MNGFSPVMKRPVIGRWKRLAFVLAACVLFALLLELALHGLSAAIPKVHLALARHPSWVWDKQLEWRGDALYADHDRKGFRNRAVPDEIDVIAMGDSQTYGIGVERDEAWPAQLSEAGGLSAYNMAFGGWGPVHCLVLFPEALSLEPRVVVVAFYSGNDLYDAYRLAYAREPLADLRTTDSRTREEIRRAESESPIEGEINRTVGSAASGGFREYLAEHSTIFGLLRTVRRSGDNKRTEESEKSAQWATIRQAALDRPDREFAFESDDLRTVFTPKYRRVGLNVHDPRIAEGERIAFEAIKRMEQSAHKAGVRFFVLRIPTKELVFEPLVGAGSGVAPEEYRLLVEDEQTFWAEADEFFRQYGIRQIDSIPFLRQCLERGVSPYKMTRNGHPNAAGHRAIADSVLDALRKAGLANSDSM